MGEIVFHVPELWLGAAPEKMPRFYRRLSEGLAARGIAQTWMPMDRATLADRIASDSAFHILNHARHPHPRVLTAGIAYIYPYWHLDPLGIRAFSTITDSVFRPAEVDGDSAQAFFRRLRQRMVGGRQSRYPQQQAVEPVPEGSIAVFLQTEGQRSVEETLWLDRWTMLDTCLAAADGRPVVVKPHPRDRDPDTGSGLAARLAAHPNLHLSTANIHDILATADRVVTINSAVGIEALLHRKPVILCGKADFHHICTSARDPQALRAALRATPPRRAFARYIAWYFGTQCLDAGAKDLTDRVLDRLAARGCPL